MKERMDHFIHVTLHVLETVMALLTLVVLVGLLGLEIYRMFTVAGYFATADRFLRSILTLVVGLEFVRMLTDITPANILEVLIVAISRYVVLSHEDPWSNLACVACIAGLFAIRRYLIPKKELTAELSEVE